MEQNTNEHDPVLTRLHLDHEVWADIRSGYEAGEPARLLAERYGVHERTVRRRAAGERWPRRTRAPLGVYDPHGETALDFFVKQRREETDELLLAPSPEGLLTFAFRRATEAAALGRPSEAGGWLRLVDQLRRNLGVMQDLAEESDPAADVRRAVLAEALHSHWSNLRGGEAPPPESPASEGPPASP